MKHLLEYLREEMLIIPCGEVTTTVYEDTIGAYTGESILINGKEIGVVVAYIDYVAWLEKKYEEALKLANLK